MSNDRLYLRPNIQVEPLFDQWYAWSHLIPPATAARNLTERHLKIMSSYINAPQVHANAVKNPKLMGGPFIDYEGRRVDEIKALLDDTKRRRPQLIELSNALAALDDMLRSSAKGFSLQSLYEKTPNLLKGYVELAYDLNNNPSFRILEPLLYRSRYYDESAQSLMLSRLEGDHRAFVLSTPRLESETSIHLRVPFASEFVDELFKLKTESRIWGEILDLLNIPESFAPLARSFFTPEAPPPPSSYEGDGLRWRYFGHACVLVESAGVSLLFDPMLSYTPSSGIPRYTFLDLPDKIDHVVITHNHQDHVLFESLLQIRSRVKNIIVPPASGGFLQDPSMKLMFQQIGFKSVTELDSLDSIDLPNGSITALPFLGEHSDLNIRAKTAYLVRVGSRRLLFAADSSNIEPRLYDHLHEEFGDVDALFLGMECDGAPLSWLYGPLLSRSIERAMDESRRLAGSNYEQARALVKRFNCKSAFVYAMGQEPWLGYIMSLQYTDQSRPIVESNRLVQECQSLGIEAERLYGMKEAVIDSLG
jgi:L-ascorbate metabolism protein UlaG (beta-lactamase superfamily)